MTEEFDLSKNIEYGVELKEPVIKISKVKELIRLFKKEISPEKNTVLNKDEWKWVCSKLDNFTGNKFIEKEKKHET